MVIQRNEWRINVVKIHRAKHSEFVVPLTHFSLFLSVSMSLFRTPADKLEKKYLDTSSVLQTTDSIVDSREKHN